MEGHLERLRERRAEDHVADRSRLVVDEPVPRVQPRMVECRRPEQAHFFLRREDELDPGVRTALGEHAPRGLEHRRHRRFVVRAEDRPGRVPDDSLVVDDRLDPTHRLHRIEVRAEEDRRPGGRRLEPRVQVSDGGADLGARPVLVHVERTVAQVRRDDVGDRPLLTGRARDRRQLGEELEDLGHFAILEKRSSVA